MRRTPHVLVSMLDLEETYVEKIKHFFFFFYLSIHYKNLFIIRIIGLCHTNEQATKHTLPTLVLNKQTKQMFSTLKMYKQRIREDGTAGGNNIGSEDPRPPPALPWKTVQTFRHSTGWTDPPWPSQPWTHHLLDPLPSGRSCRVLRQTDLETPASLGPPGCWVIT